MYFFSRHVLDGIQTLTFELESGKKMQFWKTGSIQDLKRVILITQVDITKKKDAQSGLENHMGPI